MHGQLITGATLSSDTSKLVSGLFTNWFKPLTEIHPLLWRGLLLGSTSNVLLALQPLCGFGLSKPGHHKPSYSAPVLPNYSHSSPSNRYIQHPANRLPIDFHSNILFAALEEHFLCMWYNRLIPWVLIILTVSAPLIRLSSSRLLGILLVFSPVRSVWSNFFKMVYV